MTLLKIISWLPIVALLLGLIAIGTNNETLFYPLMNTIVGSPFLWLTTQIAVPCALTYIFF